MKDVSNHAAAGCVNEEVIEPFEEQNSGNLNAAERMREKQSAAHGEGRAPKLKLATEDGVTYFGEFDTPEAQAVLASHIAIMQAGGRQTPGNRWLLTTGEVAKLLPYLSKHPVMPEKDGLAFVFAEGRKAGGKTSSGVRIQYAERVQSKILRVTAFFCDVDGTDKARRVAELIRELGYFGVVYTTYSHHEKKTERGDRFRVIIFLEQPFEFPTDDAVARREAVAEYHARYAGFCEKLGLDDIDASGMNLHQMMYTPRRASEAAEFEHYIIAGRALRIEDMPKGDVSKYRKKGPSHGNGRKLSEKDRTGKSYVLRDNFNVADWFFDGGKFILLRDVLELAGWDVRGDLSNGWFEIQCPNHAQHSDPDDDAAAFIEDEDGCGFNCFHAHCADLNVLDLIVLIEAAIEAGEAVLPDGYDSLSDLLCDPALYPEIDGEELTFDPADYGVEEVIELEWLSNAKRVERAFKAVVENDNAGADHYAALYAGVEKAGGKDKAVAKLDELMKAQGLHDANTRKALGKRGKDMLAAERAAYATEQAGERRREAEEALERADLANLSMDPAEPLGGDLKSSLATLRHRYAIVDAGGKFRVVRKPDLNAFNSDFDSTIVYYTKQDFIDLHLDRQIGAGDDMVDPAKEFLKLEKRKSGIVFAPPPCVPGVNDYNMYQGRKLESKPGDWRTLRRFFLGVVCNGDRRKYRWLILWMADMVQRPGLKPGTAVIATGSGGVGKGTFGAILMKLAAPHTKQLENESHVIGQFAGEHLSKCILVVVNEAVFGRNPSVSSTLKAHVDSASIQVEAKGMNLTTAPSYMRMYFDSNDAVPVLIENNGSERRYFVLRFSDAEKQDLEYFGKVREAIEGDEMRALLSYLEEYSPASAGLTWNDVRTAPETPERVVMGEHSMRPAMRRLKEALAEGEVTLPTPEGPETYCATAEGLRVPCAAFREYIVAAGDKRRAEDADVEGMFARLFPDAVVAHGQGTVGSFDNKRWWLFPAESIGQG